MSISEPNALHPPAEWIRSALADVGGATVVVDTGSRVLFLNPVAEQLTLEGLATGVLTVFDAAGRLVFEEKIGPGAAFNLDVKNWKSGFYVVVFRNGAATGRAVFIKK